MFTNENELMHCILAVLSSVIESIVNVSIWPLWRIKIAISVKF